MYPMTHHTTADLPRYTKRERSVRAVCPDCQTDDATSLVPVTNVLVLYHCCARCHLVWATDFVGNAISRCGDDSQEVTVRLKPDRRLTPRDQQLG